MITDYSKALVRCSAIHEIMTNIKSPVLTSGHLTFCKKFYRELKYQRRPVLKVKAVYKGIHQEEDAITLLTRVKGLGMVKKNEQQLSNLFISGTPDVFIGESIRKAQKGYDTKCSWSLDTFPFADDFAAMEYKLPPEYFFQDQGYMALTGAPTWSTVYALVNAPGYMITNEKYALSRAMGDPLSTDPKFIEGCKQIERNMIFDMEQFQKDNPTFDFHTTEKWEWDIPMKERLLEFEVERNEQIIDRMYERVKLVREKLNELAGKKLELIAA